MQFYLYNYLLCLYLKSISNMKIAVDMSQSTLFFQISTCVRVSFTLPKVPQWIFGPFFYLSKFRDCFAIFSKFRFKIIIFRIWHFRFGSCARVDLVNWGPRPKQSDCTFWLHFVMFRSCGNKSLISKIL